MLIQKSIKNIYLGEYTEPTPSTIVLFDDDFTTMSNSQLIAQWFLSVGDSYGLTTSSNWLHRVTFETDTASWVEFRVTQNLVWRKLCWELEWYAWTFTRRWNIWFSLDRPANYSNKRKKYDVVASCAWWGMWLWSLPGYDCSRNWCQYAGVNNGAMGYRNWTSADNIDMYWDKWNKWLHWNWSYNWSYYIDLPFTTWIYKGRWYADFWNWINYIEWENPSWTKKSFSIDFTSDDASKKSSLNTWLAGTDKYIRLTSNRWYWYSSDDVCYRRKAKVWIE